MISITKIISTSIDSGKRFLKFLRLGKSDVQTSYECASYGVDSNPIKGVVAVYSDTSQNGKDVVIGYINVNQLSKEGETRIYATDKNGNEQLHVYLKNDGSGEIGGKGDYLVRYNKLEIAFNQLKAEFNAHVTAYNAHTHIVVGAIPLVAGVPPVTIVPVPIAIVSTADITPAKIGKLETI